MYFSRFTIPNSAPCKKEDNRARNDKEGEAKSNLAVIRLDELNRRRTVYTGQNPF